MGASRCRWSQGPRPSRPSRCRSKGRGTASPSRSWLLAPRAGTRPRRLARSPFISSLSHSKCSESRFAESVCKVVLRSWLLAPCVGTQPRRLARSAFRVRFWRFRFTVEVGGLKVYHDVDVCLGRPSGARLFYTLHPTPRSEIAMGVVCQKWRWALCLTPFGIRIWRFGFTGVEG